METVMAGAHGGTDEPVPGGDGEREARFVIDVLSAGDIAVPAELLWSMDELAGCDVAGTLAALETSGLVTWDRDGHVGLTASGRCSSRLSGAERARLRGVLGRAAQSSRSVPIPVVADLLLDGCRVQRDSTVVPWLLERADRELREGRLDDAATVLAAVVDAVERGHEVPLDIRVKAFSRRSYVLRWLGSADESRLLLDRAVATARASGDAVSLAVAAVAWRPELINVTDDPHGVALVDEALSVVDPREVVVRSRLLAARAEALLFTDLRAAQSSSVEALALARRGGDAEAFIISAYSYRVTHWHPSRQAEMLALGSEMVAASPRAVDSAEYGAVTRLQVFLEQGDWPHFDSELLAMGRRLSPAERPSEQLWWRTLSAARAQSCGDWRAFEADNAAAMELAQRAQHAGALQLLATQQLLGAWHRGEDLRPLVADAVLEASPAGPMRTSWESALLGWTCTRRAPDDVTGALDRFLEQGADTVRADLTFGPVMSSLAIAAAEVGSVRHAAVLYDALLPFAGQWAGTSGAVVAGPYALHLGRLAMVLGSSDAALELLTAALESCRDGECRPWEARVELALAEAATTARDRPRHARRAAELAGELAMSEVEQSARRLLGVAVRPAGLTRREVEVLRALGSGATNQEIADGLYVSLKTVERHLLNAYRKIGARNRAEAVRFALQELSD
jgi:DNA-binding CsgD family transcriptional regulator